jgi:hypothetical protein
MPDPAFERAEYEIAFLRTYCWERFGKTPAQFGIPVDDLGNPI